MPSDGSYQVDVLVQGFPGRAVCHGGLGWSTITLLRGAGRVALLDVGAFGVRRELAVQLAARGLRPTDVTDVILTHAHYDHCVNFTLFPQADIWIGEEELKWAVAQPPGFDPLPELYVRELASYPRLRPTRPGDRVLDAIRVEAGAGHTPGHLLFYLERGERPVLFTGDSAKNRAELLSMQAHAAMDERASRETMERIWALWRRVPGTLLVPGHDLTMILDDNGAIRYLGERRAAISAWFGESIHESTDIDLCVTTSRVFTSLLSSPRN